jgi:hypothetical protein
MKEHTRSLAVVYLAAITGWFWRIGMERWPTWQPVLFMGGMVILFALAAWPSRPTKPREDA